MNGLNNGAIWRRPVSRVNACGDYYTYLHAWRDGADELSQRHTEQLHEQDREQLEEGASDTCSALPKAHRVHHQDPVDNRA